jgi:hypothetical protein
MRIRGHGPGARTEAAGRRDEPPGREPAQAVPQGIRARDPVGSQLVGRLVSGLHRGATGGPQSLAHLHAVAYALGTPGASPPRRSSGGLSVDRIGLTVIVADNGASASRPAPLRPPQPSGGEPTRRRSCWFPPPPRTAWDRSLRPRKRVSRSLWRRHGQFAQAPAEPVQGHRYVEVEVVLGVDTHLDFCTPRASHAGHRHVPCLFRCCGHSCWSDDSGNGRYCDEPRLRQAPMRSRPIPGGCEATL